MRATAARVCVLFQLREKEIGDNQPQTGIHYDGQRPSWHAVRSVWNLRGGCPHFGWTDHSPVRTVPLIRRRTYRWGRHPGNLRGKRWKDARRYARPLSRKKSSGRCNRLWQYKWDGRGVLAVGPASRPGNERGPVMKWRLSHVSAYACPLL